MKQVASHFGGTRNPVVMNWPARIKDKGGLRSQFHHVIDIAPTILEAAGIPEPLVVNGVSQRPIEGVSMAYTWNDASAEARRTTQYFEMFGNRALYHDGWSPPVVTANFRGKPRVRRISIKTPGSSTTSRKTFRNIKTCP
jgi:arylsulfatase